MENPTLANLIGFVRAAQRIAVITHVSPDGDACGSALALCRALLLTGKDARVVCDHPAPAIYTDLEGALDMRTPDQVAEPMDLAISVDVADCARMGDSIAVFNAAKHTVQIDHHATNPGFAEINWVVTPMSATGVLIYDVIKALGVDMDYEMAKCLYVAIITDTGNFKQQNTDVYALEVAARCLEAGVDPSAITRRVFDLRPVAQVKLMARAFESLTTYEDGRIVMMQLTHEDFEETGGLSEHTEGIINFGINTKDAQLACILSNAKEKIRCSMRCLPPFNVSRVAARLGGGGHVLAAGCTLEPPMADAYQRMLKELTKELNEAE